MKVALWGAGGIGIGLGFRLATCNFVSSLAWINRDYSKVSGRVVDIEHGLAFAPSCRSAVAIPGEDRAAVRACLQDTDILIITQGKKVEPGSDRDKLLESNVPVMDAAAPSIEGFKGIVLVISNPVDALTRRIQDMTDLPSERIMGLGTVVETARLRAAVAGHMIPAPPPRTLWCYAVGTHDNGVQLVRGPTGIGLPDLHERVWASLHAEVVKAPARVKAGGVGTLHPVVEGAILVARCIAHDTGDLLTVSVRDEASGCCFSVPVAIGRGGVLSHHIEGIPRESLEACRAAARAQQTRLPDLDVID